MEVFHDIQFHGTFRDYQQRVLDRFDQYAKDRKIHIVAAPGSGKTVLGLELIRRLHVPCMILSPTTSIREQWGQRFAELFISETQSPKDYFSNDLHTIRPITSITYQALYTAMERIAEGDVDDPSCADVDILSEVKKYGIGTICLDEAHHLRNEWQKALERFMGALGERVFVVSLTATPPYDSEPTEWKRYISLCGDIDEEIFVPELVSKSTLCPHQDYIYFNYPEKAELDMLRAYRDRAATAIHEIGTIPCIAKLAERLNQIRRSEEHFADSKGMIALFVLLQHYGFTVSKRIIRSFTLINRLPKFTMSFAETAIEYLLSSKWISESEKQDIVTILRHCEVYEKQKVSLKLNDHLKRALISSVGKLKSIETIVRAENDSLGDKLRLLVLTDYIKRENTDKIATDSEFLSVNCVSIFETIRRSHPTLPIGVLSGSLVILPNACIPVQGCSRSIPLKNTEYSIVQLSGSNHDAVCMIGNLFREGQIRVLVGTKSLLGEGWDSPCINALILASFVGSFVLSNQMRGRAIRIDKNDPYKTANIWHLVTVEPHELFTSFAQRLLTDGLFSDHSALTSYDYEVLKRRFDTFMGPSYDGETIESGIQRLTDVSPPYHDEGIARINAAMLRRAAARDEMSELWKRQVTDKKFEVLVESAVPFETKVPIFTFYNAIWLILLMAAEILLIQFLHKSVAFLLADVLAGIAMLLLGIGLFLLLKHILSHCDPVHSIQSLGKAVYRAMRSCGLIGDQATVETLSDRGNQTVSLVLRNATVHDQNVFQNAMRELLSPIENPRYLLIKRRGKKGYRYRMSFACPTELGKKKEFAEILRRELSRTMGKFAVVYAHRENGRRLTLRCRRRSYITACHREVHHNYKVSHYE